MKILLTRPYELSVLTQNRLHEIGIISNIIPMIEIHKNDIIIDDRDYDYIIVTSQNAVHSVEKNMWMRSKKFLVVGDRSFEKLLKIIDKENIKICSKNNSDLISEMQNNISNNQKILYLSSDHISKDFISDLSDNNFCIDKEIVYRSIPREKMNDDELFKIKFLTDVVLLYSSRTTEIMLDMISKYNMEVSYKTCICISNNCAKNIPLNLFKDIKIANSENEDDIFKLL
jgi:uroporphyrinogen-III synthase